MREVLSQFGSTGSQCSDFRSKYSGQEWRMSETSDKGLNLGSWEKP